MATLLVQMSGIIKVHVAVTQLLIKKGILTDDEITVQLKEHKETPEQSDVQSEEAGADECDCCDRGSELLRETGANSDRGCSCGEISGDESDVCELPDSGNPTPGPGGDK